MGKPVTIKVTDGGALSASLSTENVGEANYVRKLNLRREGDQEKRREGWTLFKPDAGGSDNQSVYDGVETLNRLAELRRPNGERVVVAASRTKIKKFDTATGLWSTIGSGYSAQGKRWQVDTMNGYLVLNNTVDLIVSYRVEEAAVVPMYELRDVGIARVGRLRQNNGFILIADITEIQADQLDKWMRGYSNFPAGSTSAKAANFAIVVGDSTKEFDVTTGAGNIVATLPTGLTIASSFYCWIKKVDAGAGHVTTSPVIDNQAVVLDSVNDKALVWWDPVRLKFTAKVFADGTVPADDPYGAPPEDILNHRPWQVANGEYSEPRQWAPSYTVVQAASSATITLPFAAPEFIAGQTRVGVDNAGVNGGMLGGQEGYENGILVTAVAGNQITLEVPTDAGLTYPRLITVTRWTDTSTLVARYNLQGDGSQIIGMETLQNLVILYRPTGIYVGRYTGLVTDGEGNTTGPYAWRERYTGTNVPIWGDCIVSVKGDYHLYPARGNRFYYFDGTSQPALHKVTDLARKLFFTSTLQESEECWAIDNPATHEAWIIRPGVLTMAFDYETNTCSEIDVGFDAAAWIQRPDALDNWFILGIGSVVSTYGLVTGAVPILTWLRNGAATQFRVKTGLTAVGDQANEKDVREYTPILASDSPDYALEVQIYTTYNPAVAQVAKLAPVQSLPTPNGENYVPAFFRALYFQVEIVGTDVRDIDFRLSAHIWEFDRINGRGVNRRPEA